MSIIARTLSEAFIVLAVMVISRILCIPPSVWILTSVQRECQPVLIVIIHLEVSNVHATTLASPQTPTRQGAKTSMNAPQTMAAVESTNASIIMEASRAYVNLDINLTRQPKVVRTSTSARVILMVAASKSAKTIWDRTDAPAEMVTN